MPIGKRKNDLYGLAMPFLGKNCKWKSVSGGSEEENRQLTSLLKKRHAVGAAVQCFEKGRLTACFTAGNACFSPLTPVTSETVFRTASLAKTITALLVFRLQTLGKLDVREDISDFLGFRVNNPYCPGAPITLAMLMNHTSSIIDSEAYFASFHRPRNLRRLLSDSAAFLPAIPGTQFKYSNFAAGLIGSMLENRFSLSFETLVKEHFAPRGINLTFDPTTLEAGNIADSWRVLPAKLEFSGDGRRQTSTPLLSPDPDSHYLLASGNAYLTAADLAKLTLLAWKGGDGFLSEECLSLMKTPSQRWPEPEVDMRHGMGLFCLEDKNICPRPLYGHQGFAYGAVNGLFFDDDGNGFACLNSGVSEQRLGHLALINRDLIRFFWKEDAFRE